MDCPCGIAVTSGLDVFVVDRGLMRVQKFKTRKVEIFFPVAICSDRYDNIFRNSVKLTLYYISW